MADYAIHDTTLTAIASAIRSKAGTVGAIDAADFATEILAIPTGGGAQGLEFVQTEYLEFNGSQFIELPYNLTSPERSYYIDFTTETQAAATGYHAIFGIKNEYNDNFVGIRYYQLRYQIGQNGGSTNISNSWEELTGHHNFLYDAATSTVYFDTNAHTYSYNPGNTIGDSYKLIIGSAKENPAKTDGFIGKIHRFTIKNTTTQEMIADYVPGIIRFGTTPIIYGFIDLISNKFIVQTLVNSNDLQYPLDMNNISGATPIISEADWNNMTDAQKRTYGLVIIEQESSGYKRGIYVNGADYPVLEEYSDVLTTGLSLDVVPDTTYTLECCFYASQYINDGHVCGTTTGNHNNFHVTTYSNRWYFEGDVSKSDNVLYPVSGGMDITFRCVGTTAYMNGNNLGTISRVSGGTFYALAQRGNAITGNNYKYKYFKIWDSNGKLLHDFRFMANKTMIDLVTLKTKTYT